ncbi:MAG TPA: DUF4232 domain-containing protein [Gaiellaceae bacterium]|jgi:hypothetical protein|nr:DUF4232 domain-containing protein [Gaiellaceae bacterium]
MKISLAALIVGAVAALAASTAFGHRTAADCAGNQLAGRFAVVPGSPGAGNITYKLTLQNTSATPCTLTGLPLGRLLGKTKQKLPTHVRAAHPGQLTAILVTLVPGDSTYATARFSPDVAGPGEQVQGPCEPKAYWFRVSAPGGGATTVKVLPPTAVCEHGTMSFSAYSHTG